MTDAVMCPIVPDIPTEAICQFTACMFNTKPGCMVRTSIEINAGIIPGTGKSGNFTQDRKAALLGATVSQTRAQVEQNIEALHRMAADFRAALDTPLTSASSCPVCGYLSKCVSQTVCNDRHDALEELLKHPANRLTAFQVWSAVKTKQASFLPPSMLAALANLLAAVDAS